MLGGAFADVRTAAQVEADYVTLKWATEDSTATAGTKPATLETGITIQVPLFINQGDIIKVDTRNDSYLERIS